MSSLIPESLVPDHPYYPLDIIVIGYVAQEMDHVAILGIFIAACVLVMGGSLLLVKLVNPTIRPREKWLIVWFAICGAIHLLVEGYFSINHRTMGAGMHYLGQGWKEYSKSDSRYMTSDPFVVCMESITAFTWGPLSLAIVWMILVDSPWRHPTQALVSIGQFYGLILYFGTNFLDDLYNDKKFCRPESYYYWCYYILLNGPWLFVPVYATWISAKETAAAFIALKKLGVSPKDGHATGIANGSAGKGVKKDL